MGRRPVRMAGSDSPLLRTSYVRTLAAFVGRSLVSGTATLLMLVASVAFSIALTLSSTFAATVTGFLGTLGVRTAYETVAVQRDTARRALNGVRAENRRLTRQATSNKQLVRRVNQRVFARTLRSTARSVSAIAVESLPVIGVAALIGTTAWEVHDGCANLNDLHELYVAFGVEPDYPEYQQTCIAYSERVEALKTGADGVLDGLGG